MNRTLVSSAGLFRFTLRRPTSVRAKRRAPQSSRCLMTFNGRMPQQMLLPPGYTSQTSLRNFLKVRAALPATGARPTAEGLIDSGTALIGSPKTIISKIEEVREKTGLGILVALLQFGPLSEPLARRNLELFCERCAAAHSGPRPGRDECGVDEVIMPDPRVQIAREHFGPRYTGNGGNVQRF